MNQSINFRRLLLKSTSRISLWMMCLVILVTVIIFIFVSVFLGFEQYQASERLENAQVILKEKQAEYDKLANAYPLLANDVPLTDRVKALEQEFQARMAKFDSLTHLVDRQDFSKYMLALAQVTPNTLWLNQIKINNDTLSMTLNGYTVNPDAMTQFMGNLLNTQAFKNVIFHLFFVKTIKNHPYMKFSIGTKELGPKEEMDTTQTDSSMNKSKE